VGTLRRCVIEHVTGCDNGPRGSYFIAVPEKPIEDIILHDVHIGQHASLKPATRDADFDDLRGIYPDAHMIDDIGDAPAYGLWARHVKNLYLLDHHVQLGEGETRPEYVFGAQTEIIR